MEIRVLRYFLEIAREGNMSRAAERLHVTQPTLSKQMNGAVFVREGLGVELTFDKLVETNAESDLCFRPITPPLHTKMYVIWKKYQIFTPVANLLLEEIKKIIVLP